MRYFVWGCVFLFSVARDVCAANIGLLIVATGKYVSFVPELVTSAEKYFCKGHKVTYFVFTDGEFLHGKNVVVVPQARLGWPYDTMMRYEVYRKNKKLLESQDYLYACDADMRFCAKVGDEILGDLVATQHPGYFQERGTYETNSASKACVYPNEGKYYFAGGFYGGSTKEFFRMIDRVMSQIICDLKNGIIAIWHDESHWNRYCIDHPPTVVLSPSYCYYSHKHKKLACQPKLMALDKDHNQLRQ